MVEEDRGITDANYVDVVTLTSLPPHLITASVAGRRMRWAGDGGRAAKGVSGWVSRARAARKRRKWVRASAMQLERKRCRTSSPRI